MADSSTIVADSDVAFVLDSPSGIAVEFMEGVFVLDFPNGVAVEFVEGEGVMPGDFFRPIFFVAVNGVVPSWTLLTDDATSAAALDDRVACGALEVGAAFLFDDNLPVKPSSSHLGVLRITSDPWAFLRPSTFCMVWLSYVTLIQHGTYCHCHPWLKLLCH